MSDLAPAARAPQKSTRSRRRSAAEASGSPRTCQPSPALAQARDRKFQRHRPRKPLHLRKAHIRHHSQPPARPPANQRVYRHVPHLPPRAETTYISQPSSRRRDNVMSDPNSITAISFSLQPSAFSLVATGLWPFQRAGSVSDRNQPASFLWQSHIFMHQHRHPLNFAPAAASSFSLRPKAFSLSSAPAPPHSSP